MIGAGDDLHTGAGFFDTLDNDLFTRLKRSGNGVFGFRASASARVSFPAHASAIRESTEGVVSGLVARYRSVALGVQDSKATGCGVGKSMSWGDGRPKRLKRDAVLSNSVAHPYRAVLRVPRRAEALRRRCARMSGLWTLPTPAHTKTVIGSTKAR